MSIYITPWEAQTYIGLNTANDDGLLADVIDAVSRLIDNYCGDVFGPGTAGVERVFDPQSTTCIRFGPFSPLAAVTAVGVDTDDDGTFSTVIASTDYELYPLNPAAAPEPRPYRELHADTAVFSHRVEVTGTWGWAAVPAAVKMACRLQVASVFARKDSPNGIAGLNEFGVVRLPSRLDADVERMLEQVRETFNPPGNIATQALVKVEVRNGSPHLDWDILATDRLQWEGYLVALFGPANNSNYTQTQIIDYTTTPKGSRLPALTTLFQVSQENVISQPDPNSPVAYQITVGQDYTPCVRPAMPGPPLPTLTPTPAQ